MPVLRATPEFYLVGARGCDRKSGGGGSWGGCTDRRSCQRNRESENCWIQKCRPGGLNLSRHVLDQNFWSRQLKKWHLDRPKVLTVKKNDISTSLDTVYAQKSWCVSIFNTVLISTFSKPCLNEPRPPGLQKCNLLIWCCKFRGEVRSTKFHGLKVNLKIDEQKKSVVL